MPFDAFLKIETVDGERSAPSIGEIVVTKSLDSTSPLFSDTAEGGIFSAYDGDGEAAGAHPGGMNAVLCDGSVRPVHDSTPDYNPYITVDYHLL